MTKLSSNTTSARNQIVGAWLWFYVRPTMSLYMFKKYHMHTVRSLHEAKAIRSLVGDIDKAKKTTCARDDYRAFASNVSCSPKSFVPYRGEDYPIKNVAALLLEVKNGDKNSMLTTAHKAHLAHYAPAIAKRAAEFRGW